MKNELKMGSVLSYAQMGLGIIIGLIYTPVMIRLLGQNEYGLYNTVASTISTLSILSLGFNSSYVRYYMIYKNKKDQDAIYRLNGLFFTIFMVMGIIAFVCGMFLSFHLKWVFNQGLSPAEYRVARTLMLILTVNLALSFPMSVFSNIISANEKFVFLKLVGMLNTVAGPLVTFPILLLGYKSIAVVSVSTLINIITYLLYGYYVLVVMKNRFVFHNFERDLFKSLFTYTTFIAINLIIDQINWNIDKILLGRFKGAAQVAIYSVGYTLYSYYMSFSTSISGVFTPRIHSIVNNKKSDMDRQRKELTELFTKVGRVQFLILALLASGVIFYGREFIVYIWAGSSYLDAYYVALLLIIPATVALIQNLGIEIQRSLNKHQFRSLTYLVMAFINLGLSIVLCQRYGAIGSAIGTMISLVVANGLIMNVYYNNKCNLDIVSFWKNILNLSKGLICPIIFGLITKTCFPVKNATVLIISVCVYSLVYVLSMWMLGMNLEEKKMFSSMVIKVRKKNI